MKNNKWQVCVCGAIKYDNEYLMVKRSLNDEDSAGFSEYSSEKTEETKYSVQLNYVIEVPTKDLPIKLSNEHTEFVWATRDSEYVDEFIAEIIDAIEPSKEVEYAKIKKM